MDSDSNENNFDNINKLNKDGFYDKDRIENLSQEKEKKSDYDIKKITDLNTTNDDYLFYKTLKT